MIRLGQPRRPAFWTRSSCLNSDSGVCHAEFISESQWFGSASFETLKQVQGDRRGFMFRVTEGKRCHAEPSKPCHAEFISASLETLKQVQGDRGGFMFRVTEGKRCHADPTKKPVMLNLFQHLMRS